MKQLVGRLDLEHTRRRSRGSRSSATAGRAPSATGGRRLDRSAAQELRLHDRAASLQLRPAAAGRRRQRAAPPPGRSPAARRAPGGRRPSRHPQADRRQQRSAEAARPKAARARTRSRRRPVRAKRSSARRSAPRIPTRCTSSARTWMVSAGARRPTTTAPAPRWSWSWRGSSAVRTCRPIGRSVSRCGTTRRPASNGARAYVEQRTGSAGEGGPARSGRYPEPKWLG